MEYIKQIFLIFLFALAGEALSLLIPIAIPRSVIGMVLLFFSLHFGWLEMEKVADVGNFNYLFNFSGYYSTKNKNKAKKVLLKR
ncbi:hypothetical protein C7H83_01750 [Tetragenococcus halophilus]|uniref:LrgA family protein n=1 Tax=Tetragenococcus halophilus TaxID=51669 RepID=A0A3G5FG14_TETHA|nr:CidA/LrgA family protein [Tetragenococcus halophilus]AYW49294.1 hypothetical protein C7H83_01750 [Tetragenococcus halophilus]GBD62582.1 hypothetical protein TEHD23766T_0009 [Tetragenococcus halophilus subsp. flandriensis]